MHYLLFYEKEADHAAREGQWQTAHREHVFAAVERGELLLGGPLQNPENGDNVLLFWSESPSLVERFAMDDPYVINGVVCHWHMRAWETVVGPQAAHPIAAQ